MPNLKLFWDSVQNAISYNIYYSTSPGVTIETGILIPNVRDVVYHHTGLAQATHYYYIIAAVDAAGNLGTPSIEFGAVSSSVLSLEIIPDDATISTGTTQQYQALINYSDGGAQDITLSVAWDTDNHSIATIDDNGLLTSLTAGTVTVNAHYGVYDAYTSLTASHILMSITITPSSPSLDVDDILQFTATGHYDDAGTADLTNVVTWGSTDTGKATIDGYGLATGVSNGTTHITAVLGLISAPFVVLTVIPVLTSIVITPTSALVATGDTKQFTADGYYNDSSSADITNDVTWMSSNNSITTIDAFGLATNITDGYVIISATLSSIDGYATLATLVIPDIGLANWVMADAGIIQDTSNTNGHGTNLVLQWNDQSGNNTNWIRGIEGPSTGQAFFLTNAQNGLPVIHSDSNVPSLAQNAFITGSSEGEMFVIIKNTTGGTDNTWGYFGGNETFSNHYPFGSDIYDNFGADNRQGPFPSASSGTACFSYGIYNISAGAGANNFVVRQNASTLGTATITNQWESQFKLLTGLVGDLGELIVYNHVLTDPQRHTVYRYLYYKWFVQPIPTSGMIHWVNTDSGVETDIDGYVTAWRDQSGNDTDWITETTVKPQLIPSAQNGLGVIRTIDFNDPTSASIQRMSQPPFRSGSDVAEAFVVIKSNGPGDYGAPFQWAWSSFGTQGDFIGHYGFGGTIYETFGASARISMGGTFDVNSYGIYNIIRDAGTSISGNLYGVSGDTALPGQAASIFWDSTFKLFNFPDAKIAEYHSTYGYDIQFNGDIGEIIIYNRILTSDERKAVQKHLRWKWDIAPLNP